MKDIEAGPLSMSGRVRLAVEKAMPAYMIELCLRALKKSAVPYEAREDVYEILGRSQAVAVKELTDLEKEMFLLQLEVNALKVLAPGGDDARLLMASAVRLVLRLADSHLLDDPGEVAVLLALAMDEEFSEDTGEWGTADVRNQKSGLMMNVARGLGYFSPALVLVKN